jgi:putative MFS transporter
MDGFWPLGFVAAGVLSYFLLPVIGWRDIFLVLAVPAVFVLAIRFFIPNHRAGWNRPGAMRRRTRCCGASRGGPRRRWAAPTCRSRFACHRCRPRRATFSRHSADLVAAVSPAHDDDLERVVLRLARLYGLTSWLSALLQQSGFAVTQSVYYTVLISLGGIPGF